MAPAQNMAWAKLARQSSSQGQLPCKKRKNRLKLKFEVEILLTGNHYKQTAVWFIFSTTLFSNYKNFTKNDIFSFLIINEF
jgi:hypothetical protein